MANDYQTLLYKKRGKKSQIAFFIIIGIVILFIFAIIYFLMIKTEGSAIQREHKKAEDMPSLRDSYAGFVKNCIEEAAKEALTIAGMQGGVIYNYQAPGAKIYMGPPLRQYGVSVLPAADDKGKIWNVSYGIRDTVKDDLYHPPVPRYPYGFTKLVSSPQTMINSSYINTLGNFPLPGPLPPLCDYNGENSPNKKGVPSCETYDAASRFIKNSVQEYIEMYIEQATVRCTDFSQFPELSDAIIKKGNISAKTLFSPESLSVFVDYPIEISFPIRENKINLKNHQVNIRTRLMLMHELASHLIENDVNNIFFNIVNDAPTLNSCRSRTGGTALCLKEGFEVLKIKNPCLQSGLCHEYGRYDDILVISDTTLGMGGKTPYIFQFAIQNRAPALDLIRDSVAASGYGLDIIGFVGEEIIIDPKGYDPDEDWHNKEGFMDKRYNYYLWKETYDEFYNEIFCQREPLECAHNLSKTSIRITDSEPPKSWTQSEMYKSTGRMANYTPTQRDRGYHQLKVEICDPEGLCDYQVLRIMINELIVNASTNFYDDIDNRYASLEDPYRVAFPDLAVKPALYRFEFYNEKGEMFREFVNTESYLDIPEGLFENSIETMKTKIMTEFFSKTGQYTIRLIGLDGGKNIIWDSRENDNDVVLDVKECLPHRSGEISYPYNVLLGNSSEPFQGDHSCCIGDPDNPEALGWGTLADKNTKCFNLMPVEYGCRNDNNYTFIPGTTNYQLIFQDDPFFPNPDNVYQRSFITYCTSQRGNICSGESRDTRTSKSPCNSPCKTCVFGKIYCVNVNQGELCNEEWRCTNGNSEVYLSDNSQGEFSCQAGCLWGLCNYSINCKCDTSCGAECNSYESFIWDAKTCTYGCSGDSETKCAFMGTGQTGCFAPVLENANKEEAVIPGKEETIEIVIGKQGNAYTIFENSDVDNRFGRNSEEKPYLTASYCLNNDYCYVSGCSPTDGAINIQAEYCPPPGNTYTDYTNNEIYCYYGSADGQGDSRCTSKGECKTKEKAPFYNIGFLNNLPFAHYINQTTSYCIVPTSAGVFCTTNNGWDYISYSSATKPNCGGVEPVCTWTGWKCP